MAAAAKLCADCHSNEGVLEIRKRSLCHDCFTRYVAAKTLKRMESYRIRNQNSDHRTKLLLPLSGGLSSLSLLYTLDAQLQRQRETHSRTAYDLILLHVQMPQTTHAEPVSEWWDRVAARFPDHLCLPVCALHEILKMDPQIEESLAYLGLSKESNEEDQLFLMRMLSNVKTPTAQADLREILLQRLIIALAKRQGCDGILWGHSDSKLAAKVLADVAKGRGGSVPDGIADGMSPHDIAFNYPQRDLFQSELDLYLNHLFENLSSYILVSTDSTSAPLSIRHTSIDSLLSTYITSQGKKYPGVMANVVRTAGKLQIPATDAKRCILCGMSVISKSTAPKLCYGCERLKQDIGKS